MSPASWVSDGREPFVFRVDVPDELPGRHADLIGSAAPSREPLRHILYLPLWEGTEAPFGIRSTRASHAIAVTDRRFLVSRDEHSADSVPALAEIGFDHVRRVSIGTDLLLAWLVIAFRDGAREAEWALLFNSTGRSHVSAVVRDYRKCVAPGAAGENPGDGSARATLSQIPRLLAERLSPLLLPGENPVVASRTDLTWRAPSSRKGRARSLAPEAVLLRSSMGLLWAVREPTIRPSMQSFGVNVTCVPPARTACAS